MKKKNITIVIAVVIALLLIAGAVWLGVAKKAEAPMEEKVVVTGTKNVVGNSTTTKKTEGISNVDRTIPDTSDWAVYENNTLGIAFRFPTTWQIAQEKTIDYWGLPGSNIPNTYWILLKKDDYEISFEIRDSSGSSFGVPEKHLDFYKKMLIGGVKMWRSEPKHISQTDISYDGTPEKPPYDIKIIFPYQSQVGNVKKKSESAQDYYQNESLGVKITYGFQKENLSDIDKETLDQMDNILQSLQFTSPIVKNIPDDDSNNSSAQDWKWYTDNKFDFSFQYPPSYSDFLKTDQGYQADSSEYVLIRSTYNSYPELGITITPISEFEFTRIYEPAKYRYDTKTSQFYSVNLLTDKKEWVPYDISMNGWNAMVTATGDAGYFNRGYAIPYEKQGVIIRIYETGAFGDYRPLDFKSILRTLNFK